MIRHMTFGKAVALLIVGGIAWTVGAALVAVVLASLEDLDDLDLTDLDVA